jgi:hypothetical protein
MRQKISLMKEIRFPFLIEMKLLRLRREYEVRIKKRSNYNLLWDGLVQAQLP